MDIRVQHRTDPTSTVQTRTELRFAQGAGRVDGLDKLVQLVIINLLTDPSTDATNIKRGGGLKKSVYSHHNIQNLPAAMSVISSAVAKTEREMLADQAQYSLPATERLQRLRVLRVNPSLPIGKIEISIQITNATGHVRQVEL